MSTGLLWLHAGGGFVQAFATRFRFKFGQGSSVYDRSVGRKDSWAARICDDGQVGAFWPGLTAKHRCHAEQLVEYDAQDACPFQCGVEDFIAACQ